MTQIGHESSTQLEGRMPGLMVFLDGVGKRGFPEATQKFEFQKNGKRMLGGKNKTATKCPLQIV